MGSAVPHFIEANMGDNAITFPRVGCSQKFEGQPRKEAIIGLIYTAHPDPHSQAASPAVASAGPSNPKMLTITCPKLTPNCSLVQWENFLGQWKLYKRGNKIPDGEDVPHFLASIDEEIYAGLLRKHADPSDLTLKQVQDKVKHMSIIPVPVGLRRLEAFGTRQTAGQRFGDCFRVVLDCRYVNPCTGCNCGNTH